MVFIALSADGLLIVTTVSNGSLPCVRSSSTSEKYGISDTGAKQLSQLVKAFIKLDASVVSLPHSGVFWRQSSHW